MMNLPEKGKPAVAVVGATGFVGSAVTHALRQRGASVLQLPSPRIARSPSNWQVDPEDPEVVRRLQKEIVGCSAVINAAGVAESGSADERIRWGANAVLPGLIATAANQVGARMVHVSSAAVQGRKEILDSTSEVHAFSMYANSKIAGELAVRKSSNDAVIYRPPGVHGRNRPVTATIVKLAKSPFASVAAPGDGNAPQALIENVADAIAYLATTSQRPPVTVAHPSEGITTSRLLKELGGHDPILISRPIARAIVGAAFGAARILRPISNQARRLEVLWFGQEQAPSWLTEAGWQPVKDHKGWAQLRD